MTSAGMPEFRGSTWQCVVEDLHKLFILTLATSLGVVLAMMLGGVFGELALPTFLVLLAWPSFCATVRLAVEWTHRQRGQESHVFRRLVREWTMWIVRGLPLAFGCTLSLVVWGLHLVDPTHVSLIAFLSSIGLMLGATTWTHSAIIRQCHGGWGPPATPYDFLAHVTVTIGSCALGALWVGLALNSFPALILWAPCAMAIALGVGSSSVARNRKNREGPVR